VSQAVTENIDIYDHTMDQLNRNNSPDGGATILARYTLSAHGKYNGLASVNAHLKSYRVVDIMLPISRWAFLYVSKREEVGYRLLQEENLPPMSTIYSLVRQTRPPLPFDLLVVLLVQAQ
jgi:hypothetical protein